MKKIIIVSALCALASVSVPAQGLIDFSNGSTTGVSTNLSPGGTETAVMAPVFSGQICYFALYSSTTSTTVNGRSAAINGAAGTNYAFNDTHWTLVAYGTNSFDAGVLVSAHPTAYDSGTTAVAGVAGGSHAQFVVIGWSGNIGTNIAALQSWFNGGSPAFNGWIGQSAVSGSITLGTTTAATLFGAGAPAVPGFILGLAVPLVPVTPVITSQPGNESVSTGANVTFSVSAYGTPPPAYQWMFNTNTVILGATSSTLTISDVQSTNAGTYSVLITNTAGSTNSFAATLTVTAASGTGYVYFQNFNDLSAVKIYTNSSVGGAATGLTMDGTGLYYYALYASAGTTSVNGRTAPILGSASTNYAFNATHWTLVAYGTNVGRSLLMSASAPSGAPTPVTGFAPGTTAQFVAIGWSANIATTSIAGVEAWFNGGSPASDGWIGQSAVSGAIELGNNGSIPTPQLFWTNAPYLSGFTLGLASPTPSEAYVVPPAPPAIIQTALSGNKIQLSWLTASGSWGVQSASSLTGPWSDTGLTVYNNGTTSLAIATNSVPKQYYRLVAE